MGQKTNFLSFWLTKKYLRGAFGGKLAENVVVSFLERHGVPLEQSLGTQWLVVVVSSSMGPEVAGDPASSLGEVLACSALGNILGHGREGLTLCPLLVEFQLQRCCARLGEFFLHH